MPLYSSFLQEELELIEKINEGGEGEIWSTSFDGYLVKLFRPISLSENLEESQKKAARSYTIFSALELHLEDEIACLPCEALNGAQHPEIGPTPAYLMRLARGEQFVLDPAFHAKYPFLHRLSIARSLAKAVHYLHGVGVVHADIKPDNLWFEMDSSGNALVQILDIDGGGFWGMTKFYSETITFPPSVTPLPKYRSPELNSAGKWDKLWLDPTLRRQPDHWALAVLIYQILVNPEGPFPYRKESDDREGRFFRNGDASRSIPQWPMPWQENEIAALGLTSAYEHFRLVFDGTHRSNHTHPNRPTAMQWRVVLDEEIRRRTSVIRLVPSPGGIVRCSPTGIRSSSKDNAHRYPQNQQISLIATPDVAWRFVGWKSPNAGTVNPLVFPQLRSDIVCQAVFEPIQYTLRVNPLNCVHVSPHKNGYAPEESITLLAIPPNQRYSFSGWKGLPDDAITTGNSAIIRIRKNLVIEATFQASRLS